MSISRDTIYTIQMLSGTSSDEKPTDVKSGSTFKEIDTGKDYIFDGTTWVEQPGSGGGGWPSDLPKPSVGGYGYTDEDEIVHKIDEKYLPASGGAMVVEVDYDGEQFVSTKTVDEVKNAMLTMPVIGIAKISGELMGVGIFTWLGDGEGSGFDSNSPMVTAAMYRESSSDSAYEILPLIAVTDGEFVINA